MFKGFFGGETSPSPSSSTETKNLTTISQEDLGVLNRAHTDSGFLQDHFRLIDRLNERNGHHVSHVPILESSFIEKSAKAYPLAWAGRELIQNWVDAEVVGQDGKTKKQKGTLDGVTFREENLPDGYTRFVISGDWALTNLDGLVGLSSSKPDGETAGGNGIGLKQTALRFLRDKEFGVRCFDIYATSKQTDMPVKISYDMVTPDDISAEYNRRKTSPVRNISKAWLMGTIEGVDALSVITALPEHRASRDSCAYIVETNDPKTVELLRRIKDFGVSSENPYLQDPDFETSKGTVKWAKSRSTDGKLFINGQIMDYKDKTTDTVEYPGPEGVTVRLNNVKYPMSIDRPPISFIDLQKYTDALFEDVGQAALIGQLKASEHLWRVSSEDEDVKSDFTNSSSEGYKVAIGSVIKGLLPSPYSFNTKDKENLAYTYDDFKADFGENYVYADSYSTKLEDIKEAERKGYRVCLSEFSKLGVPSIKSVIDSSARLKEQRPSGDLFESAQKSRFNLGSRVFYEKFDAENIDKTREEFLSRISGFPHHIDVNGNTVKIVFDVPAGESLLIDDIVERDEKDIAENVVYACRGVIAAGLRAKGIDSKSPYMIIDGRVMTFGLIEKPGTKSGFLLVAKIPEFKTINKDDKDKIVFEFDLVDSATAEKWKEDAALSKSIIISQEAPKLATLAKVDPLGVPAERKSLHEKASLVSKGNSEDADLVHSVSEVTHVPVTLSEEAIAQFAEVKKEVPHLADIVQRLEEIVESDSEQPLSVRERLMLQWLNQKEKQRLTSGSETEIEGEANSSHLTALYIKPETLVLSLAHLLQLNNQAEIPVSLPVIEDEKTQEVVEEAYELGSIGKRIETIASRFIPDAEDLENFELVTSPSPEQLKKLSLLKGVMLAVGYEANNDLFVFRGNNVKGFNLDQKAIGLHESVLNAGFQEAFSVFRHEVAHNRVMDHGPEFIATDEAIASHMLTAISFAGKRLLDMQLSLMRQGMSADDIESEIAQKYTREFLIVNAQEMWEEMK